ncbi:MAG TPA: hypothetical protein EYG31_13310 [Porticoccaceae bacterium]|nr:hypothetical protein [Gammaproteobacteria bacterium]HIL61600.1 hypothetical protein [Porticoccaceae bacterium]
MSRSNDVRIRLRIIRSFMLILSCVFLISCVGTVVGVAVDASVEIAKIPFKVIGAAVDIAVPGDSDD